MNSAHMLLQHVHPCSQFDEAAYSTVYDSSGPVVGFIKGFSGSLELLIHRQQIFHPRKLSRVFPDEEDDVLHLNAALASDGHGFMGHLSDELDHQVLQNIHGLCVRILVVAEAIHHTTKLFREQSLPSAVTRVCTVSPFIQLLIKAGIVVFLRHVGIRSL